MALGPRCVFGRNSRLRKARHATAVLEEGSARGDEGYNSEIHLHGPSCRQIWASILSDCELALEVTAAPFTSRVARSATAASLGAGVCM